MNQHNFFVGAERFQSTDPIYMSAGDPHLTSLSLNTPQPQISTIWLGTNAPTRTAQAQNEQSSLFNQNEPRLQHTTAPTRINLQESTAYNTQENAHKKRKPLKRMYENKPAEIITPEQHHLSIKDSPSYFLGLLIDSSVINWLISQTNQHGKNMKNFTPVTEDEMRCFIAILFLSGYVEVPRRRMLWERSPDTHCPLVSNAMQRDRFESIFTTIHAVDTSKTEGTNLTQIQPLVYLLNEKFLHHTPINDQHTIAQCTVSISAKHHNAKGPGKFLKVWCACTATAYCTWFNPVPSNESSLDPHSVILHYASYVKHFQLGLNNLLIENRYLKVPLICELRKLGIQGTGAEREKSSCHLNPPLGGVDKLDSNLNLYRTSMQGKKSYYSTVLTFCLDLALNNAWQLYKIATRDKKPLDLLGFRRNIVVYYLQHYAKPILSRKGGRIAKIKPNGKRSPPSDARYDGVRHYVIPQDKQTRCARCSAKTTTRCQKCDIGVHVKCFVEFHTRPKQLVINK